MHLHLCKHITLIHLSLFLQQEQQWLCFGGSISRAAQLSDVDTEYKKVSLEKGQDKLLETQH